jgi:hypothetical protein
MSKPPRPEVKVWSDPERDPALGVVWIGSAQVRVPARGGGWETHFFEFGGQRFPSRTEAEAHASREAILRLSSTTSPPRVPR